MSNPIQLIVGLGNPGPEYVDTRHNAGAWLVDLLAEQGQPLRLESKWKGRVGQTVLHDQHCRLLVPETFMNLSGLAVRTLADFYHISPEEILVIHDDLDLAPGDIRLKKGGGHGGHNGLRDIISHLNTPDFYRLRIGIGHPGHKDQVASYVLHRPSKTEQERILSAIESGLEVLPDIAIGHFEQAMQQLHTRG